MPGSNDKAEAFLESCVKNYKIFIDTCSILSEQADKFWNHIVPMVQREKKTLIIPLRVYEEVEKFADNPALCAQKSDPELNRRAKKAQNNISMLQRAGVVEVFGDKSDNFADNVFQTVFTQFRLKYNLMLITQDNNLASDISAIGNSKAVNTKNRIMIARINKNGYVSIFRFNDQQSLSNRSNDTSNSHPGKTEIPKNECFAVATSVKKVSGMMPFSLRPGEGAVLTAEREGTRKIVRLIKEGPSGGEGTIYTTDIPNEVAKIYKPEKLDRAKFEKLSLMMTKSIDCEGVCFPKSLLYNQRNEFVGFMMNQANGKELQKCVFIPQLLKKYFPKWNKKDTVELCVTILKKLKYLHDRNIILGDINPNNILVISPTEVYFVDTDSYQIEGFPCPVGTINFTAPEIQRKEYSSFLRTMGHERFAVATLLFMIMLPGKPPYSLQGGENQIDNIIKGEFAYASGERSSGKAPEGMWRFCWSHLPRYLKDDFYETFRKGEKHSTEATRYGTGAWLGKFEHYLDLLKSGRQAEYDSMSMDIFPTRLKKNPNASYIRCIVCGNEVEEGRTKQGICQDCRNKTYKKIKCSVCGQTFDFTHGEKIFYEEKGIQMPQKCKNCRGQSSRSSSARPTWQPPPRRSEPQLPPPARKRGGPCFITTAACEYFNKPDNCYELETLRNFRDSWLVLQPGGEEAIHEYYHVAPSIVAALETSARRNEIYTDIWNQYILPCVRMIEQGAYTACRELYEEMVLNLKRCVLKEA